MKSITIIVSIVLFFSISVIGQTDKKSVYEKYKQKKKKENVDAIDSLKSLYSSQDKSPQKNIQDSSKVNIQKSPKVSLDPIISSPSIIPAPGLLQGIPINGPGSGVSYSPNGRQIASTCNLKDICIFDIDQLNQPRTLKGHKKWVRSISFSSDGKYMVSGSDDKTLRIWDLKSGNTIEVLNDHSDKINTVYLGPDGKYIISGSDDKTIILWDVISGDNIKTFSGHTQAVNSVAFNLNGQYFISGSDDKTIILWDVISGDNIKTFSGHTQAVISVAFHPKGKFIISGGSDGEIKMWNLDTGLEVGNFDGHTKKVNTVVFTPDGNFIFSGSNDGLIKHWDSNNSDEISNYSLEENKSRVLSIALNSDGNKIISGYYNKHIRIWNIGSSTSPIPSNIIPRKKTNVGSSSSSLPPNIILEKYFFEEPSGNKQLDAEETGHLNLLIHNDSNYIGDVSIKIIPLLDVDGLIFDYRINEGIIKGNEKRTIRIPFTADFEVKDKSRQFRIEIVENKWDETIDEIKIDFNTRVFQPPKFRIILEDFDDNKNISKRNTPDGILEDGEVVRIDLNVQNIGTGSAKNVSANVQFLNNDGIFLREWDEEIQNLSKQNKNIIKYPLGNMDVNMDETLVFGVITIAKTNKKKITIHIEIKEEYGLFNTQKDIVMPIGQPIQEEKTLTIKPEDEIHFITYKETDLVPIEKDLPDNSMITYENDLAVIIGIEEYKHLPKIPASFKVRDAEWFYEYCRQVLHIPHTNIKKITNSEATATEINYIFSEHDGWLKKRQGMHNNIFIYFGGHGIQASTEDSPRILPYGMRPEQKSEAPQLKELYINTAKMYPEARVFCFVDACFSGLTGFSGKEVKNLEDHTSSIGFEVIHPEIGQQNLVVFHATSGMKVASNDVELKHGIFTYYLLDGIKGAAKNKHGIVTVETLYKYVKKKTKERALRFDRAQVPEIIPPMNMLDDRKNWEIVRY